MAARIAEVTPRRAALVAGVGYIVIFVLAIFGNFVVIEGVVESGDAAATAENIMESEGLFRAGLVAFTIVFVVDVVIAWALYVLFRSQSRDLSLLTAWFRLVYTVLLGVALIFFFLALQLLSDADYLSPFGPGQVDAHALLAVEAFNYAWLVGLVCFGVHLILLGYLVLASEWAPRALGYVVMVAGAAYIVDTLARAVIAEYADLENLFLAIVAVPSVIGELWFTVWLLLRGGRHAAPGAAGGDHRLVARSYGDPPRWLHQLEQPMTEHRPPAQRSALRWQPRSRPTSKSVCSRLAARGGDHGGSARSVVTSACVARSARTHISGHTDRKAGSRSFPPFSIGCAVSVGFG
jgi:hypothetical protein